MRLFGNMCTMGRGRTFCFHLVLIFSQINYFHIRIVLSVLPVNIVSVFFEYIIAKIVPECPVKVCTISLDLGSTSHILIVLSAEPVIKKF